MILEQFNLKDRVALVTGANRGLGQAMALGLAEAGAKVITASRSLERNEEFAGEWADAKESGTDLLRDELRRRALEGWTRDDQRLMFRHAAGLLPPEEAEAWKAVHGRMAPPLDGLVSMHLEIPDVRRWAAERPNLYPLTVTLRDAD